MDMLMSKPNLNSNQEQRHKSIFLCYIIIIIIWHTLMVTAQPRKQETARDITDPKSLDN